MNDLHRELAPISEAAWEEIEDEAKRTLKRRLAGRRLVDVSGPHGPAYSSVSTGRVGPLGQPPVPGVEAAARIVQPLIEVRVPFVVDRTEVDAVGRGAKDADWTPVKEAAIKAAQAEDTAIFDGYPAGGITGINQATENPVLTITDDYPLYPGVVAEALNHLRTEGVEGPYAIALGPRCHTGLTETAVGGYPVIQHVRRLIDGPIVWAPAVSGAVVLSMRGGDFELVLGQDLSIGYLRHSDAKIELYIQESFVFRAIGGEAAVTLRYRD
jgi:uncharacterized linocin/CFP29 family protein